MPPILALFLSLLLTLVVSVYDWRRNPRPSLALWVPSLWLLILGSRSVSQWLNLGAPLTEDVNQLVEGSPVDRAVLAMLMLAGLIVLINRRISWMDLVRRNPWIAVYFLYCGISVLWSDYPNIAFKRWIKGLGDPIIALVLLTELDPAKAVEIVLKRCAYLLVPLSIVFIKYYGDLGRSFDPWSGHMMYTGVTTNKNLLGYLLFVFGLFFSCILMGKFGRNRDQRGVIGSLIVVTFLGMIAWLFRVADSKTPILCLAIGVLVLVGSRFAGVRKYWGSCVLVGIVVIVVLQLTLNISGVLLKSTGRDPTLTGRTELWPALISMSVSPWLGAGFASFWLGDRLDKLWADWAFKPNQAHNGYLEIYLNLGWVGLLCAGAVILSSFAQIKRRWLSAFEHGELDAVKRDFARFGMAFLTGYLVYNITEAAFHFLNFLFVIFLIVVIEPPQSVSLSAARVSRFGVRPSQRKWAPSSADSVS